MKRVVRTGCLILLIVLVFSVCGTVAFAQENPRYVNPDTGYSAIILDDGDLLSVSEEETVLEEMKAITRYGNIAVYTVTKPGPADYADNARLKRKEMFGYENASLFMIDLYHRKIYIQSYGSMFDVFTNAQATNITNNIYRSATNGNYGECATQGMVQMAALLKGNWVPQPMKYLSSACISLALGLLLMFRLVRKHFDISSLEKPGHLQMEPYYSISWSLGTTVKAQSETTRTYRPSSSGCSGGSSGGCGGGGGGGGCGGGGGSSF